MAALREVFAPWDSQPGDDAELDWGCDLLDGCEFVLLGSRTVWRPIPRSIITLGVAPAVATARGLGATGNATNGFRYPLPTANGGSTPWTIAGIFMPLATPVSFTTGMAGVAGLYDVNNSGTYDRTLTIKETSLVWRSYLFDGGFAWADSTAVATVGRADVVIATASGSQLTTAVAGYPDATISVANTGFTGYGSAHFSLGGSYNLVQATVATPLLLRVPRYWDAEKRKRFQENPWCIFKPQSVSVPVSAAGPSFKPYWARRRVHSIGAGVI